MITASTETLGLIGSPVEHSFSPQLHNHIIDLYGLDYVYLAFQINKTQLSEGISGIKALGLKGVNVTLPHKQKVIKYLDEIDFWADKIGAVNTINNKDGRLIGYNTDAIGFKNMLDDNDINLTGKKTLILGAGGAAHAVGSVFCEEGVDYVLIANRTKNKAHKLAKKYDSLYPECGPDIQFCSLNELSDFNLQEIKIVVDTTPVGMYPQTEVEPVIPVSYINSEMIVIDLVYSPRETVLLKNARKKGAQIINGLGMLLHQAAESFYIWTDIKPEIKEYRNLFENL